MKVFRKIKEEKGSITMTTVAALLFMTAAIAIASFSLSNQSIDQNKKIKQTSNSYTVTNAELTHEYKEVQDELDRITTMSIEQAKALSENNYMIAKTTNTTVTDNLGNTFVVPAGFKVTNDAENVTEGMVIQDKDENEFVWIPVGIKKKSNENETITLGRYSFDSNGNPVTYNGTNIEEDSENISSQKNYGNKIAKNIHEFITKTNENGGFFIGRYEARVEGYTGSVSTDNTNEVASWTGYNGGELVEKPNAHVFNYITQNKAAELSRNMYNNNYFESDLINSYAWDTAVLFLQEYDNRSNAIQGNSNYKNKYSLQIRLSTDFKDKGTNKCTENNKDKICNVYDMADNCFEWTTETYNSKDSPCTKRGGRYNSNTDYTSKRTSYATTTEFSQVYSFRPILYIK